QLASENPPRAARRRRRFPVCPRGPYRSPLLDGLEQPRLAVAKARPCELPVQAPVPVQAEGARHARETRGTFGADAIQLREDGVTVHAERVKAIEVRAGVRPVVLQRLTQFGDPPILREHPGHVAETYAVEVRVLRAIGLAAVDVRSRVYRHIARAVVIQLRFDQARAARIRREKYALDVLTRARFDHELLPDALLERRRARFALRDIEQPLDGFRIIRIAFRIRLARENHAAQPLPVPAEGIHHALAPRARRIEQRRLPAAVEVSAFGRLPGFLLRRQAELEQPRGARGTLISV